MSESREDEFDIERELAMALAEDHSSGDQDAFEIDLDYMISSFKTPLDRATENDESWSELLSFNISEISSCVESFSGIVQHKSVTSFNSHFDPTSVEPPSKHTRMEVMMGHGKREENCGIIEELLVEMLNAIEHASSICSSHRLFTPNPPYGQIEPVTQMQVLPSLIVHDNDVVLPSSATIDLISTAIETLNGYYNLTVLGGGLDMESHSPVELSDLAPEEMCEELVQQEHIENSGRKGRVEKIAKLERNVRDRMALASRTIASAFKRFKHKKRVAKENMIKREAREVDSVNVIANKWRAHLSKRRYENHKAAVKRQLHATNVIRGAYDTFRRRKMASLVTLDDRMYLKTVLPPTDELVSCILQQSIDQSVGSDAAIPLAVTAAPPPAKSQISEPTPAGESVIMLSCNIGEVAVTPHIEYLTEPSMVPVIEEPYDYGLNYESDGDCDVLIKTSLIQPNFVFEPALAPEITRLYPSYGVDVTTSRQKRSWDIRSYSDDREPTQFGLENADIIFLQSFDVATITREQQKSPIEPLVAARSSEAKVLDVCRFLDESFSSSNQSVVPAQVPSTSADTFYLDSDFNDTIKSLGIAEPTSSVFDLVLNVEGIHSSAFLEAFPNLRRLEINVNQLSELRGVGTLTAMRELSASDNRLSAISELSNLTNLVHLCVNTNLIKDISVVSNFHSLSSISCNSNAIEHLPIFSNPALQKIECAQNHLQNIGVSALSTLASLTHLDVSGNALEHVSGHSLSSCPLLQTVILSRNKLSNAPNPLRLPFLRTLWLSGNRISSLASWGEICEDGLPALVVPMIEKLYLQDNSIELFSRSTLASLGSLVEFDVSFNRISSLGGICHFNELLRVVSINLKENPIIGTYFQGEIALLTSTLLDCCPRLMKISGINIDCSVRRDHDCRVSRFRSMTHRSASNGRNSMKSPDRGSSLCESHLVAQGAFRLREVVGKREGGGGNVDEDFISLSYWDRALTRLLMGQLRSRLGNENEHTLSTAANFELCDLRAIFYDRLKWVQFMADKLKSKTGSQETMAHDAARLLQSCWRGFQIRRTIRKAPPAALDDYATGIDNFFEQFEEVDDWTGLLEVPELAADWLSYKGGPEVMVYGSHKRPRSIANNVSEVVPPVEDVHMRPASQGSEVYTMGHQSLISQLQETSSMVNDSVIPAKAAAITRKGASSSSTTDRQTPSSQAIPSCKAFTSTSGSFGGKPKVTRAHRGRKQGSMPAWMLGEDEN